MLHISPVIIQEIPHCNVYKLDSNHELTNIYYKTYGQNLDTLYKNIYGVELQQTGYNSFFNDRRKEIIGEEQDNSEDVDLISDEDSQYLGDEAFLKYLEVKEEIEKAGEVLSKE